MAKYWLEIKIENNSWWEGQSIGTSRTCECQHWQSTSLVSVWNCGVWWYQWHNLAVLTGDHHCMGNVITSQDLNGLTVLFYPTTAGERWMCMYMCVCYPGYVWWYDRIWKVFVWSHGGGNGFDWPPLGARWRDNGGNVERWSPPLHNPPLIYINTGVGRPDNLIKPGQICFVDPWNMEWNECWWWFNI